MAWTTAQVKAIFTQAAQANGLDLALSLAQIQQESSFNANAVSSAGAQGAAQFMPGTWKTYGSGSPFDPNAAAKAWAKYMRHLLGVFQGRWDLALAGYNGGENRQVLRTALATGKPLTAFPKASAWTPTAVHSQSWNYSRDILARAGKLGAPTGPGPVTTTPGAAPVDPGLPGDSGGPISEGDVSDEDLNAAAGGGIPTELILLLAAGAIAYFFFFQDGK